MTPTMHFRYIYGQLHQFWKTGPFEGGWYQIEKADDEDNHKSDMPEAWLKEEMESIGL